MSLQPISVSNSDINSSSYSSNLKLQYNSGVGAITVYSITQFAVNQILCIGEYGSPGSELIKTHGATAPTGFTVTLAANLAKPHAKDTPVYIIPFDQVEFSHADTLAGTKTVLGSIQNIDPAQETMRYNDSVNTAGFYFTRYKNSITGVFSNYSDGIPYAGLPANTVGYAIDTAMNELDAKFNELITFEKLLGVSKQMLRLVRGKLRAWSKYQEYDFEIGSLVLGQKIYTLPTTIYDRNTNRSVLDLRLGTGERLVPVDRADYLGMVGDARMTSVATQAEIADTSIILTSTADLDDSGSIDVFVAGAKYTISYTTNTKTTNTLSGIATTDITAILPAASFVWQNMETDTPQFYNIADGSLYIWPLPTESMTGRKLLMDYYTDIEEIDSQTDVINGTKFDMLIPYLKFKIRTFAENNGKEDLRDPSYAEFRELLKDAMVNDAAQVRDYFKPRVNAFRKDTRDNNSNH